MTRWLDRVAGAWQRYFFDPRPATDLAVSRVLFFTLAFAYYLPQDFSEWGTVSPELWMPTTLFRIFALPALPAAVIHGIQIVFKTALALAAIGLATRIAMPVACACAFYLLGLPQNFGQIQHFDTLVVLVCAILAVSRAGDAWSVDGWLADRRGRSPVAPSGEYTWPIRAIWVMTAVIFFAAGFSKLRHSGLRWIFSDHLAIVLVRHQYFVSDGDPLTTWGPAIAAHPWAARLMAAIAVGTELFYPLTLVSARARLIFVPAGIAFLIGIRMLMGPTFEPFVMCSVFWVPWSAVLARVRTAVEARRARQSVARSVIDAELAASPTAATLSRAAISTPSKSSPP